MTSSNEGPAAEVTAPDRDSSDDPVQGHDEPPYSAVLELRDVVLRVGKSEALHGVSFTVDAGEMVALLGSNGAGKSTVMRAISGQSPLESGSILFEGEDLAKVAPHRRVKMGIVQAPQGRGVFPAMTVAENLQMGYYARKFGSRAERRERLDWVNALFPRLAERRNHPGGSLSGGELQMLCIGRALMARPKILLLDEPSMGLAPMMITKIFRTIEEINAGGTTVLVAEQNAQQALSRSDRAYILETGEITRSGSGRELLQDENIRAAYLGVA